MNSLIIPVKYANIKTLVHINDNKPICNFFVLTEAERQISKLYTRNGAIAIRANVIDMKGKKINKRI